MDFIPKIIRINVFGIDRLIWQSKEVDSYLFKKRKMINTLGTNFHMHEEANGEETMDARTRQARKTHRTMS